MNVLPIIVVIFCGVKIVSTQSPLVVVLEGELVGKTVEFTENKFINVTKNVDMYLGVPFASPPIRFAPPEPMTKWTGVRNATEFASACQQMPSPVFPDMDEDCLYLNVFTPSPKLSPGPRTLIRYGDRAFSSIDAKLWNNRPIHTLRTRNNQRPTGIPVMVWIHGGGFSLGSAMTYDYYGVPLVAVGDVIVVTFNYRLGIFAQLSTEDAESPGNYGMLDQVAALQWVYDNIEAFGGDKDKVTIFGESAGSGSVSFHLLSKRSRGLFSQAILQSGTALSPWAFKDDPDSELQKAQDLGRAMGCEDVMSTSALVSCLRDVEDPVALSTEADKIYALQYPVTLDGNFLEDTPYNVYKMGDFADVPLLIGFNRDEGTLTPYFLLPEYAGSPDPPHVNRTYFENVIKASLTNYGKADDILHDAVFQEYIDWTMADDPEANYFNSWVNYGTDSDFACPSDFVMRKHSEAGRTVYKYYMTHAPSKHLFMSGDMLPDTPWLGAGHADELIFVWGMPFIDELFHIHGHNLTDDENALSVKFMEFWTNFAKSGDPSKSNVGGQPGEGVDAWPLYTVPELKHKELSLELGEGRAVLARQCHFWNGYMPTLETFSSSIDEDQQEWREDYDDWKGEMTEWEKAFQEYQQLPTCN